MFLDLIVVLLPLVGGYFLYLHKRKQKAASKFREAFSEEIAQCKSQEQFRIREVLAASMLKHEKAVILFKPFLKGEEKLEFVSAWTEYRMSNRYSSLNDFEAERGVNSDGYLREISEHEQRKKALSQLSSLIRYAPIK